MYPRKNLTKVIKYYIVCSAKVKKVGLVLAFARKLTIENKKERKVENGNKR